MADLYGISQGALRGFGSGLQAGQQAAAGAMARQDAALQRQMQQEQLGFKYRAEQRLLEDRELARQRSAAAAARSAAAAARAERERAAAAARQAAFMSDVRTTLDEGGQISELFAGNPDMAGQIEKLSDTQQKLRDRQAAIPATQLLSAANRGDLEGIRLIAEGQRELIDSIGDPSITTDRIIADLDSGDPEALDRLKGLAFDTAAVAGVSPEVLDRSDPVVVGDKIIDKRSGDVIYEETGTPSIDAEGESKFRKEFSSLPPVKNFSEQAQAFGRIVASAEAPSPAGDLSMIFSYMKLQDPGSVVRESEFATAENAAAWLEESESSGVPVPRPVASGIRRLTTGQRLSAKQRADFVDRAERLYENAEVGYESLEKQYQQIAQQYGYDVARALIDYRYKGEVPDFERGPGTQTFMDELPNYTLEELNALDRTQLTVAELRAAAEQYRKLMAAGDQ